jgi:hypothetical protein
MNAHLSARRDEELGARFTVVLPDRQKLAS